MVTIDDRTGSKEFKPYLDTLRIPNTIKRIRSGDFAFIGHGPNGPDTLRVGIERKTVSELTDDIHFGRFAGSQAGDMVEDYDVRYLCVEGIWRRSEDGVLELLSKGKWKSTGHSKRPVMYRTFINYTTSLENFFGISVRWPNSMKQTADDVNCLYRYYTEKKWHEHTTHRTIYTPLDRVTSVSRPGLPMRWAFAIDGVGLERATAAAAYFNCGADIVYASTEEWERVLDVTPRMARSIVQQIYGIKEAKKKLK